VHEHAHYEDEQLYMIGNSPNAVPSLADRTVRPTGMLYTMRARNPASARQSFRMAFPGGPFAPNWDTGNG
jgi:hypothetical protein